jgi:hypothetical protein
MRFIFHIFPKVVLFGLRKLLKNVLLITTTNTQEVIIMFGMPLFVQIEEICKPGLDFCTSNICSYGGHDVCTITVVPEQPVG